MRCLVLLLVTPCLAINFDHALAGHSRHSYVDGGQSMDGRFIVRPRLVKGEKPKRGPLPYHWEYEWQDTMTGKTMTGRLEGLRSGSSNVFDPVGSHIFVAPDGETFAVWTPQVTMKSSTKKPEGERDSRNFQDFDGFTRRLVIYRKSGEVVRRFDLKDFLEPGDWQWFHYHQCQTYWLLEYPGLHTRSAPRPFYALFRISSDYTILEFQIGANSEATHRAKQRGVTPPEARLVRIRLTDGELIKKGIDQLSTAQRPVTPFIGRLADKTHRQSDYTPGLDPVRIEGHFKTSDSR